MICYMVRETEGSAFVVEGATGKVNQLPPLTFKEVLRHPLEFLICSLAAGVLVGSVWIENRLNRPGMYKERSLVKPRRC